MINVALSFYTPEMKFFETLSESLLKKTVLVFCSYFRRSTYIIKAYRHLNTKRTHTACGLWWSWSFSVNELNEIIDYIQY